MFPAEYFAPRYYAPRYWPKVGADGGEPPEEPGILSRRRRMERLRVVGRRVGAPVLLLILAASCTPSAVWVPCHPCPPTPAYARRP
jgi:hypothetical protein